MFFFYKKSKIRIKIKITLLRRIITNMKNIGIKKNNKIRKNQMKHNNYEKK